MDFDRSKTDLEKLLKKQRAIQVRLKRSDIPEDERRRAQKRLDETQDAIARERNREGSRRAVSF